MTLAEARTDGRRPVRDAPSPETEIGALFGELGTEARVLVRQEVELAKAEIRESSQHATGVGAGFGAAALVGYLALATDELTAEIQTTRGRMDRTLDDIGDRAGPGRLTDRLKGAVSNTKDTVMGTAGDARHSVADSPGGATDAVTRQSQGNPIAAGLIGFGTGILAGSVLPESRAENKLAREVQSKAQAPIREHVQESASAVSDQVGERVGEAREHIAEESRHARDEVASDVGNRTDAVKGHAQGAAEDVKAEVEDQARRQTGA